MRRRIAQRRYLVGKKGIIKMQVQFNLITIFFKYTFRLTCRSFPPFFFSFYIHWNSIYQAILRGIIGRNIARKRKREFSSIKIQAWLRMILLRKKYHRLRSNCIKIQVANLILNHKERNKYNKISWLEIFWGL